jgi:predicted NUDIX family NTP pyrophosphohydrolase
MARSAGLLLYRWRGGDLELLLGHMGGPFWAKKDERTWSIPKGEIVLDEDPLAAARREFEEEIGTAPPDGPVVELGEVRQPSGKRLVVWAIEGDLDPDTATSNTFAMKWPPRSGRWQEFPEIDRVAWFGLDTARMKLVKGQIAFVDLLVERIGAAPGSARAGP